MTPTISATALGRRYRDQIALDDVSLTVEPGTVTGLLGRNGAGKTTLMRIITGQEFPSSGDLRVFGEVPAENDPVLRRMVFVREEQSYPDFQVRHAIRVASWFYPNWSEELAQQHRITWLALPWGIMAFSFLINIGVALAVPTVPHGIYTGGLVSLYVFMLICGSLSMTRSLPFGLMMGISRRTYYAGTALLVLTLSVVYGLALTVLQLVERATNGWGLNLHYFRIPWILAGPWYVTWLTSFVLLVAFVLYGMWYGLVFRRWSVPGLVVFIAAQILVALLAVIAVSATGSWSGVGHFFTTVTALAVTGVLAVVALAMGFGGLTTLRRVTI